MKLLLINNREIYTANEPLTSTVELGQGYGNARCELEISGRSGKSQVSALRNFYE